MKRFWAILALPLAVSGATVEGVALNSVTKAGVPGVRLKLTGLDRAKRNYETVSDSAGSFRLDEVAEGAYSPSYTAPSGYIAPGIWEPPCQPVMVENGRSIRLEAPMAPLGKLHGRVLDPEGRPVKGVSVEVFRVYGASGHSLTTGSDGRFFVDNIVPGAYRIRARPVLEGTPLATREKGSSDLRAAAPKGQMWAPTYFPSSVELSGSQPVFVREGAELDGFEIRLRAAPAFRLRGSVVDQEGRPAASVRVLLDSEIGWGAAEAVATSGPDGGFEFPQVRPGEWRVSAEDRGKPARRGFARLSMPQRDLEGIVLRVEPPFRLEGTIDGLPEGGRTPSAAVFHPLDDEIRGYMAHEQPGGRLVFEEVYAGRYRADVFSLPPAGYYLDRILLGTRDITGIDVDLVAASPAPHFQFKAGGARVRGEVQDGRGVKVVFIEADNRVYVPGQAIKVAIADGDGHFSMEGLRPGLWYAFAFATHDNMNTDAIRDAVFVRGLDRLSGPIRLGEGDAATVRLQITPWPE